MMKRGILLFVIIGILFLSYVYALNFSDTTQANFNNGTYANTTYNGSAVILSGNNLTGTFTSRIFDASSVSRWNNLTYNSFLQTINFMFAVDAQADVWKSTDSGTTWILVKDDYNGADSNDVTEIIQSKNKTMYIVVTQDIWKSTDSGAIWTKINDDYNGAEGQNSFVAAFDKNDVLYIVEGDQDVWASNDYGISWTKVSTDFNGGNGNIFGIAVNSSNILFVVDNQADVWASFNNGSTWSLMKDDYNVGAGNNADGMTIDPNDLIYILDLQDVWKSTDSGATWTKINDDFNGAGDSNNGQSIMADSNNNIYIVDGSEDVFKSTDGGATFTKVATDFNGANGLVPTMTSVLRETNISFQVKNCSLANCSDSSFTSIINLSNLNLTGRYFQYRTFFTSPDTSITPQLNSVGIDYTLVDSINPNLTIISPTNRNYTTTNILVNISSQDANLQTIWFDDGSSNTTYNSENYHIFGQGWNTIVAYANDSLGNINTTSISFFVDSLAPTISIIKPEAGKTYGINTSLPLNFSVLDSGVGVGSCWYNVYRGASLEIANTSITNCQNTTFNAGGDESYTLNLYANDSLGNLANNSVAFNIVTTAPALNLLNPKNNSYLNYKENVYFNYTVDSGLSISQCEFWNNFNGSWQLNKTNLSTATGVGNFFFVNNLSDGNYKWGIVCNDSSNRESQSNYSFFVDTIQPTLILTEPRGTKSSQTNIPIIWNINDSNVNSCWYNRTLSTGDLIGSSFNLVNCSSNSAITFVSIDGSFILNFYVNDSAGNLNNLSSSFSVSTSGGGSSGGGGGGGGGSTTIIQNNISINKLELEKISNLIVEPGDEKKLTLRVINKGTGFLNNCNLIGIGEFASWVSSSETKGLSAGERGEFNFDLIIPKGIESKQYTIGLQVSCDELTESNDFIAEILEKKLAFELIKFERRGGDKVGINYSLQELSGVEQNVTVQFLLFDSDNNKVAEMQETETITANGKEEFETIMVIESALEGNLNLLVNLNSKEYSTFVQEEVILGKGLSGFTIFVGETNPDNIFIGIIVFLFLIFSFFMIRRILMHRKSLKRSRMIKKIMDIKYKKRKKSYN